MSYPWHHGIARQCGMPSVRKEPTASQKALALIRFSALTARALIPICAYGRQRQNSLQAPLGAHYSLYVCTVSSLCRITLALLVIILEDDSRSPEVARASWTCCHRVPRFFHSDGRNPILTDEISRRIHMPAFRPQHLLRSLRLPNMWHRTEHSAR